LSRIIKMNKLFEFLKLFVTVSILAYPMQVWAQSGDSASLSSPLSVNGAWKVYTDVKKDCWLVSAPQKAVNTKDGKNVKVKRGPSLLFVSFWQEDKKRGEVSYTGGYPYRNYMEGSGVILRVDSNDFELFSELGGQVAWAKNSNADIKITNAMKRGTEATIIGFSKRGTKTVDTVSLRGFTAAFEDAEKRCPE